jgi:hypothetical protein
LRDRRCESSADGADKLVELTLTAFETQKNMLLRYRGLYAGGAHRRIDRHGRRNPGPERFGSS